MTDEEKKTEKAEPKEAPAEKSPEVKDKPKEVPKKEAAPRPPAGGSKPRGQASGRGRGRGGKRSRGPRRRYDDEEKEAWVPKTEIGRKVQAGEVTDINDILRAGIPIMEGELVDTLLPELSEEVVNVRRVQRTLDSGRRMRFSVLAAVGDRNGHVGVGISKGTEAGPTIKKAIGRAKLNIIEVKRGCSSWECGCGELHTVPYKVTGKKGSVTVTLKPAPKGVGLVAGDNSKILLDFAGIQDVWTFSKGHSRTVINQVLAVYDALKKLSTVKPEASKKAVTKKTKA